MLFSARAVTPIPAGTEFWLGEYGALYIGVKPDVDDAECVLLCTSQNEIPAGAEFFLHGIPCTVSLEPPEGVLRCEITREDIVNDGLSSMSLSPLR